MIAKKNSGQSLEKNRVALFHIGLLMASAFTLAAFTYETPVYGDEQITYDTNSRVEFRIVAKEDLEETPEEVKEKLEEAQEESTEEIASENPDLSLSESTENSENRVKTHFTRPDGPNLGPVEIVEDIVHTVVDVDALFPGGYLAMTTFINENVEYPEDARIMGEQGKVYISFIVEKDGSITHVEVSKSVFGSIDREAKRVVGSFPKWKPGEVNYTKVRTKVSLPMIFTLANEW